MNWVRRISWILAFAGAVPFAAATIALLWGDANIRVPAIFALVTLSAIVLSHLGGIEGGLALREEGGTGITRASALALSVVPSLAAWGVLWLPSAKWQVATSAALFIAVWAADLWLARHGLIPSWFVDLRTAITAVVVVILAIAFFLL